MAKEKLFTPKPGFLFLLLSLGLFLGGIGLIVAFKGMSAFLVIVGVLSILSSLLMFVGFFIVNPNESAVLIFFGDYHGTVKANGFFWISPFYVKKKVSLRARNLNGEKLKVNDAVGNPIEIAAVIVWQVVDTAKASFEVDDYDKYVTIQSEAAVRALAGSYPYDHYQDENDSNEITLRSSTDQISEELERMLNERLDLAGVRIIEARISHLAYSPEIASAMLQRQQAQAVVAARHKIVEGAVGMVEMALEQLSRKEIVQLDEERKAAMVSNLLVVLCSDRAVNPVVNTGTLHH